MDNESNKSSGVSWLDRLRLEWMGTFTAMGGSWLFAFQSEVLSPWGWVSFAFSNIFFVTHSLRTRLWWMVVMQTGFVAPTVVGLYGNFEFYKAYFMV